MEGIYAIVYLLAAIGVALAIKEICGYIKSSKDGSHFITLSDFLDDFDEAVIVVRTDGRIRYINREARKLFPKCSSGGILDCGDLGFDYTDKEGQHQFERNEKTYKITVRRVNKSNRLWGYKLFLTDVSNLVYLEKQVEQNSEKNSRLLTDISHEVRTPLNAIIGAAEVLSDKDEQNTSYVEMIRTEAMKLNRKLDRMLSASSKKTEITLEDSEQRTSAEGIRALVVDDNKVNLIMAKQILEQLGAETVAVESGYACINLLENGSEFDIIFMDYMMDGINGTEATEYIRRLKGSICRVPIIAFTANSVEGAREMYLAAGMNDCLFKPAGKQAFAEMLKKYVPNKLCNVDGSDSTDINTEGYPDVVGIDYTEAVKYSGGNPAVFKDIVATFYKESVERITRIKSTFEKKDFRNFVVEVHGVKSQARTMGMMELSEAMADMEQAGKDENDEYIETHLYDLIALYNEWTDRVAGIALSKSESVKEGESDEPAEKTLRKMHELLEEFEMEDVESLFNSLWQEETDNTRKELMRKLKDSIDNIDYYASLDYVDQLLNTY